MIASEINSNIHIKAEKIAEIKKFLYINNKQVKMERGITYIGKATLALIRK
ncbi:MAG: hypothetical protein ABF685_21405 [Clostridium saccharoperbutylacetonicum]